MVFAQGLAAIIVFWAVIGGLGAALYLPAMQSLIHGNFEGKMQAKVYAMIGAAGAIAAAIGPLIGGALTTLLSWRVGFMLEAVIIGGVLFGSGMIREEPYTRRPQRRRRRLRAVRPGDVTPGARGPRVAGGRRGGWCAARGRGGCLGRARLVAPAAQAGEQGHALRPGSLQGQALQLRDQTERPAEHRARRPADRAADLPPARPRLQRAAGRNLAGAALADDVLHRAARRQASRQAAPEQPRPGGLRAARPGRPGPDPDRPAGRTPACPS